jgi:hypothetical protein
LIRLFRLWGRRSTDIVLLNLVTDGKRGRRRKFESTIAKIRIDQGDIITRGREFLME